MTACWSQRKASIPSPVRRERVPILRRRGSGGRVENDAMRNLKRVAAFDHRDHLTIEKE